MLKLRNRILFFFIIISVLMVALAGRLFYIQVIWRDELTEQARLQQNKTIPLPAKRGDILDRKGDKLAFSIKTYSLWAHAEGITKPLETATLIATTLDLEAEPIANRIIEAKSAYVRIISDLTKSEADLIRSKGIRGISVAEDTKRIYPYGHLASHVIGNVNADHSGFLGLEFFYDTLLKGTEGTLFVTTDVYGRQLAHGEEQINPPVNGHSLQLTLDDSIQFFVEQRLEEALYYYEAKAVSAVVMDPYTGEIIAMGSKPDFDLNDPRAPKEDVLSEWGQMNNEERMNYWGEMWKNAAISNTYEPGSIFKAVTAAIGLEEKFVHLGSTSTCTGFKMVNGVMLRCWNYPKAHGHQTFVQAFANSCNPTFIELGSAIGSAKYYEYLSAFGLMDKTKIDLPAEAVGISIPQSQVGPIEMATLSYGHGINVTMVQMANAVSAMVNGGTLMKPFIVGSVLDDQGNEVTRVSPEVIRRVVSEETSDAMRTLFKSAVESGGGRLAAIPGIEVGGKTGTSKKFVDGAYSDDFVVASFVAIAPMSKPKYLVLVTVDEPKTEQGGSLVAAPLAKKILEDILRYENIVPDTSAAVMIEAPDVSERSLEEAIGLLEEKELHFTTDPMELEEGVKYRVVDQFPKPGIKMEKNTLIILSLQEE